jgi:hypothetical protein
MLSAWQIVSLDYSEWIDAVAYADLDGKKGFIWKIRLFYFKILGTVWVARGDSSTWTQNSPKYRPSAVRKPSNFFSFYVY